MYFLHLLPGGSTSQESSTRGNIVGQGLMANFACLLSSQDGVKQTLSDWRPSFATKVKARENRHSGGWRRWSEIENRALACSGHLGSLTSRKKERETGERNASFNLFLNKQGIVGLKIKAERGTKRVVFQLKHRVIQPLVSL